MKIKTVDYFRLDMPLAVPYTIAYETVSQAGNIILHITTDTGLSGWGCAAPDLEITGETQASVEADIDNTIRDLLLGESPFQIARFTHSLKTIIPQSSAAIAMVDMALYDLLARQADLPLFQLLGGYRKGIPTSITIAILPVHDTLEMARRYFSEGFTILKLKGGLNLEEDIEKILRLREVFGADFGLRFDANQGYTAEESIKWYKQTKKANVEIIEQPTKPKPDDQLSRVTENVSIPVMADESIKTLGDAFHLASNNLIDMVNIKIMKVGGILESQHINSVAKAAGMEVMVGCLDECALGISAGLHFALSRPNIEFADLDGHIDLKNDPFEGLFTLQNGILIPTNEPGLGHIDFS
jgi:L-alanine-DL-glutamate epimerase-like enolase superfamily enzyme